MNLIDAFMQLDKIAEAIELSESGDWLDRETLIKDLKAAGKHYNFNKYSDEQLYRMWEREQNTKHFSSSATRAQVELSHDKCDKCSTILNPLGQCPSCDLGEKDLTEERVKSAYHCSECGFFGELYDDEVEDGCCPRCHDHHGGFVKCEESTSKNSLREAKKVVWKRLLREATELSTEHAVTSVVDQIKAVYEAGLFSKLPVGRDNAFTLELSGPDKSRLAGYFARQPEFTHEVNNACNILSHKFISNNYNIEIFDSFIQMYKIPQNESL